MNLSIQEHLPITYTTIRVNGVHEEGLVTISSYQVDGIIKTYNKQNRLKMKSNIHQVNQNDKYGDVVTLSVGEGQNDAAYKAISYNLLGIILNSKER
jgi:hypothetical protein